MKKSQAALEFLMTYGWAFLIIVVIVGGFVYLGVLNPDRYVAERCITSSGFSCDEFKLTETGTPNEYTIKTKLRNFVGAKITFTSNPDVKSDMCTNNICIVESTNPNLNSGNVQIEAGEDLLIETTISVPHGFPKGQKVLFDLDIEYMQYRKDFPKTMQIEFFAELN